MTSFKALYSCLGNDSDRTLCLLKIARIIDFRAQKGKRISPGSQSVLHTFFYNLLSTYIDFDLIRHTSRQSVQLQVSPGALHMS